MVNAASLVAIVVCSGAITSYEFGRDPIDDTERGEWTNGQPFYTLAFTIGFSLGSYFLAVAVF